MRIIGIDAGGSKTRVILGDIEGWGTAILKLISERNLEPFNYRQDRIIGLNKLIKRILSAFEIKDIGNTLLLGGFAGAGTDKSRRDIRRAFEKRGFRQNLTSIVSDADLLLLSIGNNGIVLNAGTGSICVGRTTGSRDEKEINVRAGGYGFRTYSEPGGYQLGMRAIDIALMVEDGRKQETTVLHQRIRDNFSVKNLGEIVPIIYSSINKHINVISRIAGLSKVVLQAAHEGDKVAVYLVKDIVDKLADHIHAVYKRLGLRNPLVGLHGGLFADAYGEELLINPLTQHSFFKKHHLRFITLGVKEGDMDPLIESMKYTIHKKIKD